jgi:phage tail sheath gpL-like
MSIGIENIPASTRKPGVYLGFRLNAGRLSLPDNAQKMIVIGQKLASGTVKEATPVDIYYADEAATYFGYGSVVHLMVKAALNANTYVALSAIGLDDPTTGALAATGKITIGAAATKTGVLTAKIGAYPVSITVNSKDEKKAIADSLVIAINEISDLPVLASSTVDGEVAITSKNKGVTGNDISLTASTSNDCVQVTVTTMAGGVGFADIKKALDAIFPSQYNIIVTSLTQSADLTALKEHLDLVCGPLEQREGIGVYGLTGALADMITSAAGVNSWVISPIGLRKTASLPYELAAAYGSVMAGEEDPAMPLNTLPLTGIEAPAIPDQFDRKQQEALLKGGVTPVEIGPSGTPQIVRAITSYTKNAQNVPDATLLDVTTPRSLFYVRKACRTALTNWGGRKKLNDLTITSEHGILLSVLKKLEDPDLQIVEKIEEYKAQLQVKRNIQDATRTDAKIPSPIVRGLHIIAGVIDLI